MAVTRTRQVVSLAATNDALTGEVVLQAILSTGTDIVLQSDDVTVFKASADGKNVTFPCGLALRGVKRTAGTGDLFLYLK